MTVRSRFFDYDVHFVSDLVATLQGELGEGDVLVVDDAVLGAHGDRLAPALEGRFIVPVEGSERAKSFERIGDTLEEIVRGGFRRGGRVIAIGGGVTQDVAAFIATTIYRGVEWVFVPTTLLAQGDSCLGGKSSINFRGYKNLLGSFLPPRKILIDVDFIPTLPESQIVSGLGEILHFLVFEDEASFAFLETHIDSIRNDRERLQELCGISLGIKKAVVERDELDTGERLLFNYGHTFGHALESVTEYGVPHGVAVSIGMDIANYVGVALGHTTSPFRDRIRAVTSKLWQGYSVRDIDLDPYFEALRRDKKNVGRLVTCVLARDFGDLFMERIDLDDRAGDLLRQYFATEAP